MRRGANCRSRNRGQLFREGVATASVFLAVGCSVSNVHRLRLQDRIFYVTVKLRPNFALEESERQACPIQIDHVSLSDSYEG